MAPLPGVKRNLPLPGMGSVSFTTSRLVTWWTGVIGCDISTTIGTLAPLRVLAGRLSEGKCSRSSGERSAGSPPRSRLSRDPAHPSRMKSPAAVEASPKKPRLEKPHARRSDWRAMTVPCSDSVPARIEFGAPGRPVDVRLERRQRARVRIDLYALVRLLDAPVDHVAQRGELADLLLELRELVRVVVRPERMAHRARHAGPGELDVQLLRRGIVPVEEQIADPHLLHEHFLERLQLLGRVLVLVGASGADDQERADEDARRDETDSNRFHGRLLSGWGLTCTRRSSSIPGPRCGGGGSGSRCPRTPNRRAPPRRCPSATSRTRSRSCSRRSSSAASSRRRRRSRRGPRGPCTS